MSNKGKIGNQNIVDRRLQKLIDMGELEDVHSNLQLKVSQEYWDKFINRCDDELVEYVLSFPQPSNWNGWLYAACEKRVGLRPNR